MILGAGLGVGMGVLGDVMCESGMRATFFLSRVVIFSGVGAFPFFCIRRLYFLFGCLDVFPDGIFVESVYNASSKKNTNINDDYILVLAMRSAK